MLMLQIFTAYLSPYVLGAHPQHAELDHIIKSCSFDLHNSIVPLVYCQWACMSMLQGLLDAGYTISLLEWSCVQNEQCKACCSLYVLFLFFKTDMKAIEVWVVSYLC